MKRYGNLWDRMISFESLLLAAHAAASGKRFKPGVARFVFDLERQLLLLHKELASKTYRPGPYRTFTIHEGKTRHAAMVVLYKLRFHPDFVAPFSPLAKAGHHFSPPCEQR